MELTVSYGNRIPVLFVLCSILAFSLLNLAPVRVVNAESVTEVGPSTCPGIGGNWSNGSCVLSTPYTVQRGDTLEVPLNASLSVTWSDSLTNNGTLVNSGTIYAYSGRIVNLATFTNSGNITASGYGGDMSYPLDAEIANQGSFTTYGNLTVSIYAGAGVANSGKLANFGTITLSNSASDGIVNFGTVTNYGVIHVATQHTTVNSGTDGIDNVILVQNATFTNRGTITVSTADNSVGIVNSAGNIPSRAANFINDGNITVTSIGSDSTGIVNYDDAHGTFVNDARGTITISNRVASSTGMVNVNATVSNLGTLNVSNARGTGIFNWGGGTIVNDGMLVDDGTIVNNATVSNCGGRTVGTVPTSGNFMVGCLTVNEVRVVTEVVYTSQSQAGDGWTLESLALSTSVILAIAVVALVLLLFRERAARSPGGRMDEKTENL